MLIVSLAVMATAIVLCLGGVMWVLRKLMTFHARPQRRGATARRVSADAAYRANRR